MGWLGGELVVIGGGVGRLWCCDEEGWREGGREGGV